MSLCTPITCPGSPRGHVWSGKTNAGHQVISAPTILPPGPGGEIYTAVGASAGAAFGGPPPNPPDYLKVSSKNNVDVFAAPTVTIGGRLVVVNAEASVYQYLNGVQVNSYQFGDEKSMARGATSSTHIFFSTTKAFRARKTDSNDIDYTLRVEGGGVRAPVIGPTGNVYNLVKDTLYIHGPHCSTEKPYTCQFVPPGLDNGLLSQGSMNRTAAASPSAEQIGNRARLNQERSPITPDESAPRARHPIGGLSPDHQRGHDLEIGLQASRARECPPAGGYWTGVCPKELDPGRCHKGRCCERAAPQPPQHFVESEQSWKRPARYQALRVDAGFRPPPDGPGRRSAYLVKDSARARARRRRPGGGSLMAVLATQRPVGHASRTDVVLIVSADRFRRCSSDVQWYDG